MRSLGEKICKKCGITFKQGYNISKKEWDGVLYCSHSCANSANSNPYRLKEYIKQNGPRNKGKMLPRGKDNPQNTMVDKICICCNKEYRTQKYRENSCKFCSIECSREYRKENATSTANELIRKNKEGRLWKALVFERDNWMCQCCGDSDSEINAHHIQNFASNIDLRFDTDNGITLCRRCHYQFHSEYGIKNNNKIQLDEFLAAAQEA